MLKLHKVQLIAEITIGLAKVLNFIRLWLGSMFNNFPAKTVLTKVNLPKKLTSYKNYVISGKGEFPG